MAKKSNKLIILLGLLGIGYFLYKNSTGDTAGNGVNPSITSDPLFPEVSGWTDQTGAQSAKWKSAIMQFTPTELENLHTLIYQVWGKVDPFNYYFSEGDAITAGQWFMNIKQRFGIA